MRKVKIHVGAVAVIAAIILSLAPVSYGEGSSVETYGGQGGTVAGNVASGTTSGPGETAPLTWGSHSTALPFTGLDLALLGGGGPLLVLAGAGMASLVGRTSPDAAAAPAAGLTRLKAAE